MLMPHTVTIFNVSDDTEGKGSIFFTVLHGVLLDESISKVVSAPGMIPGSRATLYIPFDVTAADSYIDPIEYLANPEGHWTLQVAGESSPVGSYFVPGEIQEKLNYAQAKSKFPSVYRVTSVATRNFGARDMQHWEVTGN